MRIIVCGSREWDDTSMPAPSPGRVVATTRTTGTLTVRVTAGPELRPSGRTDVKASIPVRVVPK